MATNDTALAELGVERISLQRKGRPATPAGKVNGARFPQDAELVRWMVVGRGGRIGSVPGTAPSPAAVS
ncbi:hypothetical protein [Streptomyces inhibens]|uniref:hypothetical protein n=1 Tax=Streptomyces inhibens TaxID=2293571 RepID=UPI003CC95CC3